MTPTATTPEVKSARHKLDGVLQGLVSRRHHPQGCSPRSESDDGEEAEEATAAVAAATDFPTKDSRKPPRKKRRKEEYDDGGGGGSYHHTYVMKLFDRSVDLAQFRETTPLYPIARDWIHNQPHGRTNRSAAAAATDDVGRGEDKAEAATAAGEHHLLEGRSVADVEVGQSSSSIPDVYRLPSPAPLDTDAPEKSQRVPDVLPWPKQEFYVHSGSSGAEEETGDNINPPFQEVLLLNHLSRWRTIRGEWKRRSAANESRYSESMTLLKKMFEDSQANMG